jgi:hypothetical protein
MRSGAAVLERTMTEDVRAVLEAIAFGDDGRVTPSDRLRALEHLSRMEPGQQPDGSYSSELAALEGEELDRHLDALLAEQIAADVSRRRISVRVPARVPGERQVRGVLG